jgi:nucleotide-binding universal stress UspA family protein
MASSGRLHYRVGIEAHDGVISTGCLLMTYSTLMVHLNLGVSNEGLLDVAADLAGRFNAHVIGIAACQPLQISYGDGYMSGDLIEQDRLEMSRETTQAEAEFRAALHGIASRLEWRSTVLPSSLAAYVAEQAGAADLLIVGPEEKGLTRDFSRRVNVGELVMQVARPVLLVPPGISQLNLENVVVGWKETREARRAISDALPLLKQAGHVTLLEIAAAAEIPAVRDRLQDVADWLGRHGITAETMTAVSQGNDAAELDAIAQEKGAGLLVAGAYGHSRLREWMLGGVTRNLMLHPARCSFVSH